MSPLTPWSRAVAETKATRQPHPSAPPPQALLLLSHAKDSWSFLSGAGFEQREGEQVFQLLDQSLPDPIFYKPWETWGFVSTKRPQSQTALSPRSCTYRTASPEPWLLKAKAMARSHKYREWCSPRDASNGLQRSDTNDAAIFNPPKAKTMTKSPLGTLLGGGGAETQCTRTDFLHSLNQFLKYYSNEVITEPNSPGTSHPSMQGPTACSVGSSHTAHRVWCCSSKSV